MAGIVVICIGIIVIITGMIMEVNGDSSVNIRVLSDGLVVTVPDKLAAQAGEWEVVIRIDDLESPRVKRLQQKLDVEVQKLLNQISGAADRESSSFKAYYSLLVERARPLCEHCSANIEISKDYTGNGTEAPVVTTPGTYTKSPLQLDIDSGRIRVFTRYKILQRRKRGLTFVGDFMRWAFDTATKADVTQLKEMINEQRQSDDEIRQFTNRMATVMDKTTKRLQQTEQTVNMLIKHGTKFEHKTLVREMLANKMALLETTKHSIEQYYMWTYKILHELETGRLGETIMPRDVLEETFKHIQASAYQPLPILWYYSNVEIAITLATENELIFTAALPLVRNDDYLKYDLRAFPVPMGNKSQILNIHPTIAYNTVSGEIFVPDTCRGFEPTVCRTGPKYYNRYQCELGIITNNSASHQYCDIQETPQDETLLVEIESGKYVVSSLGEEITILCEGTSAKVMRLEDAAYFIEVAAQCRLRAGGWSLDGAITGTSRYTVPYAKMNLLDVDLKELMDIKIKQINDIAKLEADKIEQLSRMNEHYDIHKKVSEYAPYGNVTIILCIISALAIVGVILYKKKHAIQYMLSRNKEAKAKRADNIQKESQKEVKDNNLYPMLPTTADVESNV